MILPYILKTIWCMNIVIWDYESVWPKVLPQNKYRSHYILWPSDFALYLKDYLMYVYHTLGVWISTTSRDVTFDLKINVGHCDLYSMVQWFCLISWRLFDAWILLFGIMNQYDLRFYLKINIGHTIFYGPVILRYILKTIWCMNIIFWD